MTKGEIHPEYMACPIRQVISQFGDKWSMLVLYTIYKGGKNIRYSEIKRCSTARRRCCQQPLRILKK